MYYPQICFYKQGESCYSQILTKHLICHLWQSIKVRRFAEEIMHPQCCPLANTAEFLRDWLGGRFNHPTRWLIERWEVNTGNLKVNFYSWLCKYSVAFLYAQEKKVTWIYTSSFSVKILSRNFSRPGKFSLSDQVSQAISSCFSLPLVKEESTSEKSVFRGMTDIFISYCQSKNSSRVKQVRKTLVKFIVIRKRQQKSVWSTSWNKGPFSALRWDNTLAICVC